MGGKEIIDSIKKEVEAGNEILIHADGPGYNDHSGDSGHNKSA